MATEASVVVLVHGLWMNRWAMAYLGHRLRASGFGTAALSYPSLVRNIEQNAAVLGRFLAGINASRLHLVGHSLGGVVCLRYLALARDPRVHRVVLMGAPVRGNRVGARLAQSALGRRLLGKSAPLWEDAMPDLRVDARYEVGAIVGTRRFGAGSVLFAERGAGDGVVLLEEADYAQVRDTLTLHVSHSGMLISPRIVRQVAAFLARGAFVR